jgi:hypothetical protein
MHARQEVGAKERSRRRIDERPRCRLDPAWLEADPNACSFRRGTSQWHTSGAGNGRQVVPDPHGCVWVTIDVPGYLVPVDTDVAVRLRRYVP